MKAFSLKTTSAVPLACGLGIASGAWAQDLVPSAPPQERPVTIVGATIHPVVGDTVANGSIRFEDGVISAIGPGDLSRPGDEKVPADGMHVWPGLIGAHTTIGLVEIGAVSATVDTSEVGEVVPEVYAAVAVNPDTTLIPVTRANGILSAGVFPQGGAIPGRASVIRLDGWTYEDLTIDPDIGLIVNWPNMRNITGRWWVRSTPEEQEEQRKLQLAAIEQAFDDARAYFAARQADPSIPTDIRFEAMRPTIEGEDPVYIRANELEQIQSAVSWATSEGLRPILVGGRDAGLVTDLLKAHDIGVIVTRTHKLPKRADSYYDEPFTALAELERAGVEWCLAGGGFGASNERNLPYQMATAVAYGLGMDAAIRGLTINSARLLGQGDRLGSLEPGKSATLIVTDGNPLEITTSVRMAFIDGKAISLDNKHKQLNEKYREKYRQLDIVGNE